MIQALDKKSTTISNVLLGLIAVFLVALVSIHKSYWIFLAIFSLAGLASLFRKKAILNTPSKYYILTSLFYVAVSVIIAFIHDDSLKRVKPSFYCLAAIPIFYLFFKYKINKDYLYKIIYIVSIIYGMIAIYGRFILDFPRAFLNAGATIESGMISSVLAFSSLSIAFFYFKKNNRDFLLSLCGFICGALGAVLSTSRGALVVFPILFIFILVTYYKKIKKYIPILIILTIILSAAVYLVPQTGLKARVQLTENSLNKYYQDNNANTSLGSRFALLKAGIIGIERHPFIGYGEDGIKELRSKLVKEHLADPIILNSHLTAPGDYQNEFIQQWLRRGIFGLIAVLAIFLFPLFYFLKVWKNSSFLEDRLVSSFGVIVVISYIFISLSDTPFRVQHSSAFYFIIIPILYSLMNRVMKRF
ncbi:MAG: O-antigen ligase family protein [Psittacicella sp.]